MARRRRKPDPLELAVPLGGLLAVFVYFRTEKFPVAAGIFQLVFLLAAAAVLLVFLYVVARSFVWHRNASDPLTILTGDLGSSRSRGFIEIGTSSADEPETKTLTLDLLRTLEWKRFERLSECYFEALGFRAEATRIGADGGIDIHLFNQSDPIPAVVVQCKAWNSYSVGVKPIRELFGVMAADSVEKGIFLTTSTFTEEARSFACGKQLELIDGPEFIRRIKELPAEQHAKLLSVATDGDYTTPSCPSCGCKMISRTATKGTNAGSKFWGCPNYPRCRQTFQQHRA